MTAKTIAQRQAEFYRRRLARGLKLVKVWVPPNKVKQLRAFAAKLLG